MGDFSKLDKMLQEYGINKHERDQIINDQKREIKKIKKQIEKGMRLIRKDLEMMYDSFIDQFYKFKTTSYRRHGTSKPGLKYGVNLYQANNFFLTNDSIGYDINADKMKDYRYQNATKEEVLDYVLNGYRYKDDYGNELFWIGEYTSRIDSSFVFIGNIQEALEEYGENFEDILLIAMDKEEE